MGFFLGLEEGGVLCFDRGHWHPLLLGL